MTVCIAAECEVNTDDPKIIMCTDTKLSGSLGSSETMLKTRALAPLWRCLTAGADADLLGLLRLLKNEFSAATGGERKIDETNALQMVRTSLLMRERPKK
jgi:hypothetical protein